MAALIEARNLIIDRSYRLQTISGFDNLSRIILWVSVTSVNTSLQDFGNTADRGKINSNGKEKEIFCFTFIWFSATIPRSSLKPFCFLITQVLFALNQTLRQHETYRKSKVAMPYTTDDLIHHYNCGDLNSIIFNQDSAQFPSLVNTSLPPHDLQTAKMIDSYFRNELIHKRNRRMASRVGDLIRSHPKRSFFFAFGAGETVFFF